jgi:hypothetical protein
VQCGLSKQRDGIGQFSTAGRIAHGEAKDDHPKMVVLEMVVQIWA